MFENAQVLVAGGTGFIGVNIMLRLRSLGAAVRATLHRKPPVVEDDGIEYMQADLTRMEECMKAVAGMDYVFMCAANTSGAAVMKATPLVHVTPNLLMNSQILEASYLAGVKKFIWFSSNAAYPPTGDRPVREDELFDDDPYDAYFPVAWMKRYTEILCRMYSEKLTPTMPTVVLRPSNIYGPYDDFEFETSHVTAALIRKVIERHDPIEVWGTGQDVRDVIYIDDFVDATIAAAEQVQGYEPLNVGLGKGYSVMEILQTAIEVDGYEGAKIECNASKPSMIPIRLIDTHRIEERVGFRAATDLREGLSKTIDWYRKTRNLPKT